MALVDLGQFGLRRSIIKISRWNSASVATMLEAIRSLFCSRDHTGIDCLTSAATAYRTSGLSWLVRCESAVWSGRLHGTSIEAKRAQLSSSAR